MASRPRPPTAPAGKIRTQYPLDLLAALQTIAVFEKPAKRVLPYRIPATQNGRIDSHSRLDWAEAV
jgi:hypothetical protein